MRMILFGQVHPLSGGWSIEGPTVLTFDDGTWSVTIRGSNVVVAVEGDEPSNVMTFVNEVRSAVGAIVDALGFGLAIPLRLEMTHAVKDGEERMLIRPGWPDLLHEEGREPTAWLPEDFLAPIVVASTQSLPLRHALADVQRAIEFFDDTAFYCYRALESLCLALAPARPGRRVDAAAWKLLRDTLAIERDRIDAIKEHADVRRHGRHSVLTEDERKEFLLLVRRAIRDAASHLIH